MIDALLVAGLALLAGQLACQEPFAASAALVCALWLARPRMRTSTIALACLALVAGIARTAWAMRTDDIERAAVRSTFGAPARCAGQVTVASSPMHVGDRYALLGRVESLACDTGSTAPPGTIVRLYAADDDLARGDRLELVATLGVLEIFRNPETRGARTAAIRSGAMLSGGIVEARVVQRARWSGAAWIDRLRTLARRRIAATYAPDASPMARALVLGESDLPDQDAEAFRISGLSHLLAVSGTHIVVAVLGLVRLLDRVLLRVERLAASVDVGRVSAAIGIPLSWFYAEFAGGGGSVRRAAWMTTAALAARALARQPDGTRAFGLSLLGAGLADPLAGFDLSFGLSAGATAGLLLLSRPLEQRMRILPKVFWPLTQPLAATVSATAFCAPWLAALAPTLSLVGLVANLVAVPIGEAISLPACLIHLVLSPVPPLERGVALLGSGSLLAVRAIARAGAKVAFLAVPVPRPTAWQLAALSVGVLAVLLRRPRDRSLSLLGCAAALVLLEIAQVKTGRPRGTLRVNVLDVGQGDSILIDFPNGQAMLIDGGGIPSSPVDPGVRVVAPVLRERRRSRVDLAVLSHPHPDHVKGLASTLPRIAVGAFWDSGFGAAAGAPPEYSSLCAAMRSARVPIRSPADLCGKRIAIGGATLSVLAPCPAIDLSASANDNSFVIRIAFGRTSAMLMGDAEAAEEARILASGFGDLHADLLKVGHHGSATSSTDAWLDAVRPSVAVITSGVRNRYGHPAPDTLRKLAARGTRVFRSDLHGQIRWESDGTTTSVRTWASP